MKCGRTRSSTIDLAVRACSDVCPGFRAFEEKLKPAE
jgi:hypothetical protein